MSGNPHEAQDDISAEADLAIVVATGRLAGTSKELSLEDVLWLEPENGDDGWLRRE